MIPRYGYMGAAYSAVTSYLLLITLSIALGRRIFAIRFPFKPAFQIACSVALMAAVLGSVVFAGYHPRTCVYDGHGGRMCMASG